MYSVILTVPGAVVRMVMNWGGEAFPRKADSAVTVEISLRDVSFEDHHLI